MRYSLQEYGHRAPLDEQGQKASLRDAPQTYGQKRNRIPKSVDYGVGFPITAVS